MFCSRISLEVLNDVGKSSFSRISTFFSQVTLREMLDLKLDQFYNVVVWQTYRIIMKSGIDVSISDSKQSLIC